MWKALLGESFRAWASVLLAVPVNFIVMLNFGRPGDPVRLITLSSLVMIAGFLVAYVGLSLGLFLSVPHAELRRWVAHQKKATFLSRYVWLTQPGGGLAMYFSFAALLVALLVLPRASELIGPEGTGWVTGGTVLMVFAGWLAVATTYAIDYLVTHHQIGADALVFPGTEDPKFSDYLYFAVGVTAAFAPPDVSVRSSLIRRRMTLQMLIGFVFATVTLAAVVGLAMSQLT